MSSIWFTADFHFGHFNIIRYCNRPFADSREMDEALCERVNTCAKPNDTLYFLGDFCMGGPDRVTAYRKRLACRTIHFVEGNHDKTVRKLQHLFASWNLLSEIHAAKQRIVLCHYAMRVWPHHAQGAWHLYGHSHGSLPDEALALSLDVGVDTHDFRPWHFDEIQAVMLAKVKARTANSQANRLTTLSELADCDQESGI